MDTNTLIDMLKESGTGASKLETALREVGPKGAPADLVRYFRSTRQNVTAVKAEFIVNNGRLPPTSAAPVPFAPARADGFGEVFGDLANLERSLDTVLARVAALEAALASAGIDVASVGSGASVGSDSAGTTSPTTDGNPPAVTDGDGGTGGAPEPLPDGWKKNKTGFVKVVDDLKMLVTADGDGFRASIDGDGVSGPAGPIFDTAAEAARAAEADLAIVSD